MMDEKKKKIISYVDQWMELRGRKITITTYFKERDIKSVGVYGYGRLGKHLVWELEYEGYHVPWIMDRRYNAIHINNKECKVLSSDDMSHLEEAELIVVTAFEDYYDIEAKLCRFADVEVISIELLMNYYIEG